MKVGFSVAENEFRRECAGWLNGTQVSQFKDIKGHNPL